MVCSTCTLQVKWPTGCVWNGNEASKSFSASHPEKKLRNVQANHLLPVSLFFTRFSFSLSLLPIPWFAVGSSSSLVFSPSLYRLSTLPFLSFLSLLFFLSSLLSSLSRFSSIVTSPSFLPRSTTIILYLLVGYRPSCPSSQPQHSLRQPCRSSSHGLDLVIHRLLYLVGSSSLDKTDRILVVASDSISSFTSPCAR